MKQDILKIAGVKSEAEFYKKYPTEEAFMAKHGAAFKKAAMGKSMVKKQLTQLTDFANPPQAEVGDYIGGDTTAFKSVDYNNVYGKLDSSLGISSQQDAMRNKVEAQKQEQQKAGAKGGSGIDPQQAMQLAAMFAKRGAKIKKAQGGDDVAFVDDSGLVQAPGGMVTQGQTDYLESQTVNPPGVQQPNQTQQKQSKSLATTSGGVLLDKSINALGPIGKPIGQVVNAVRKVSQSVKQAKQARQAGMLSKLALQESGMRPEQTKRRYVRPEDALLNSTSGTGSNFLQMQDGGAVGGNSTEIQNTYNPGDLYSDLGYVPLNDNIQTKQYKKGGKLIKAEDGQGLLNVGDKTMGIANAIGKGAQVVGDITSGIIDMGTEHRMKQNMRNAQQAAFQQGMRGIQNQNMAFMEDGGWVSHDWQPQVITKFGDYDVKDLFAPDKTMDTLRAGGHLKEYTEPSERALQTYAMGGELKTHWGGEAETMSENPYLPDGGETVMFRGQSHDESDGKGRTGIGITFGDNPVEVERGEPAVKLQDGGTVDTSLVVFGNMKIPSYGVSELGDNKAKGRKFKSYAADLSKDENKQNKKIEKAIDLLDNTEGDSKFDLLKINSANATLSGANAQLKNLASKKQMLAHVQNAILDTAEEQGLDSDSLAKGEIKKIKNSDMAKFGAKLETAAYGTTKPKPKPKPLIPYNLGVPTAAQLAAEEASFRADNPEPEIKPLTLAQQAVAAGIGPTASSEDSQKLTGVPSADQLADMEANRSAAKKSTFDKAMDLYGDLYPYFRPGIKNPLDPSQIMPEMYELATNQLQPVQAQSYTPILEDTPAISFQDRRNEVQSQVNAALRLAGNNPAAISDIMAKAYDAKNQINAEEFRTNQMVKAETRARNIAALNDASVKNLGIFDQQYQRQSAASSATKAQAHEALASIAEKIGKNKSETLAANVTANMYPQYSWGPNGRIYNTGTANFNLPTDVAPDGTPTDDKGNDLIPIYGKSMSDIKGYKVKPKKNGAIVKAIKNF